MMLLRVIHNPNAFDWFLTLRTSAPPPFLTHFSPFSILCDDTVRYGTIGSKNLTKHQSFLGLDTGHSLTHSLTTVEVSSRAFSFAFRLFRRETRQETKNQLTYRLRLAFLTETRDQSMCLKLFNGNTRLTHSFLLSRQYTRVIVK